MQNIRKWIQVSYVFLAAIAWILFYHISDTVWDLAKLPVPVDWFVSPAKIIAFVIAFAIFVVLARHPKINQFAGEVASELSKVTWPERKETVLSTGVIAVMIAICTLIMLTFDVLWGSLPKLLWGMVTR